MNYEVTLDNFSGPLDLLLHLIKESKVEIMDIKIEVIANQYLDFIRRMEELNLNIASEYLVMASELIEMKSKLLLPRQKNEDENSEEELDPKEALIRKLLEYEQYKRMTENFKQLEEIRQEIYTKTPENMKNYVDDNTSISVDVTLDDLLDAFNKFLERKKAEKPLQTKVTEKEITVEERRTSIRNSLRMYKKVNFFDLFDVLSKEYVVVTFLAILEMCRKSEVILKQERDFDNIVVEAI